MTASEFRVDYYIVNARGNWSAPRIDRGTLLGREKGGAS